MMRPTRRRGDKMERQEKETRRWREETTRPTRRRRGDKTERQLEHLAEAIESYQFDTKIY